MHNASTYLDPKNDFAFKKIFGREENKDILIAFLNDILDHEYIGQIVDVQFLPTVQNPDIAAKKQSILDVLCQDQDGVQYIVEMQVAKTAGFEKRAQYYASKAYSGQLEGGEGYEELKEVIFIAITDFVMFPEKEAIKSDHILLDRKTGEHDLRDLYFTFIELPKFEKGIDELENNTERWYYYLKHAPKTFGEAYKKLISSTPVLERAYEALEKSAWSVEELRTYEQVLKRDRDNAAVRAQDRQEGQEEKALEIAQRMLTMGLDIEMISNATGLTKEKIQKLISYTRAKEKGRTG